MNPPAPAKARLLRGARSRGSRPGICRESLLLAALAGLLAAPARAADSEPPAPVRIGGRLHFGLRTGFGLPLGKYAKVQTLAGVRQDDNAIGDDTHGVIPIWFDAGYRLSDRLLLGAYFMFGVVLPKTAPADDPLGGGCPEGFDCFATGVRLGAQAQYSFAPESPIDPWLGVGLGYEWVGTQLDGEVFSIPFEAATGYSGPDLLHLQGGVDFHTRSVFSVGPFGSVSAMRYTSCSLTLAGDESRCELEQGGWHGWLILGVRGVVEL